MIRVAVTGFLGLTLLLAGCGSQEGADAAGAANRDPAAVANAEEDVTMGAAIRSGNPAERPGVKVYRPKKLDNLHYDSARRMVTDLDTGDRLALTLGHAGGVAQYGFSNEKTGWIANGGYFSWGGSGLTVYEVATLRKREAVGSSDHLSRSEFEISRLAELFRASADAALPNHPRVVWVVDSRPATPDDINPQTGMPKDKQ